MLICGVDRVALGQRDDIAAGLRLSVGRSSLRGVLVERDRQRIEEELAGVRRPAPRSLAPAHLAQALDAFDDACTPEAVLTPRRIWPLRPGDPPEMWRTLAEVTQQRFCCMATLFTAFAAEAFVNDFLAVHLKPKLSRAAFRKLDRNPTVQKYVEGVAQAYGPLFNEGDEVMPHLRELFEVRNHLVHARAPAGPTMAYRPDPSWRRTYPLVKVAEWLVAVAGAASVMERRSYGFDYFSTPASAIWHARAIVYQHAADAEPLPSAEHAGRPPLISLLGAEVRRMNEFVGDARLTVDELRETRLRLAAEYGPWDAFTELALHAGCR